MTKRYNFRGMAGVNQSAYLGADRVREQMALLTIETSEDDEGWDYADADTKTHTHCYHVYPAMMIPQVARRLIRLYGLHRGTLLDPFCGSGTSLVEARLAGMHAVGIDINPFAVFLAQAKTRVFDTERVVREARQLRCLLNDEMFWAQIEPPRFFNIDYWFKPEVQYELAALREAILTKVDPDVRDFFLVAFAHTVRECSNTRKGEYKLYRLPEQELDRHQPQVLPIFWEKLSRNLRGLVEFIEVVDPETRVTILQGDIRDSQPIESETVDLIVTSPPYGDSQTTVAYGQFSRLALQWLGLDDRAVKRIDRQSLGGHARTTKVSYQSNTLDIVLEQIHARDPKRANHVKQFYNDFAECFPEITRIARRDAYGCFVVGNRTVKGIRIPTDQILIEIAECFDWHYQITYHRRIPNKRMPLRNSPSNKPGELCDTMTEEHIVVLRKEG